jgi:hypothetical protein
MSAAAAPPPVWLLDVDGVLNALAVRLPDAWPAAAWLQRVVHANVPEQGLVTLPILAARPVIEFITEVHERGTAEIRWHSTWRSAATTDLAPALGLPPIPISIAPEWAARPDTWWKIPAARRVLRSGRRLVWTDDQFELFAADPRNAAELDALRADPDALLLCTDADPGLTPADLERIAGFLGT